MLNTVGLWRAILQRIRADWPVVLAAALLLACATTLLATGTLYGDTVALGGLRRAIIAAPPSERVIVVTTTGAPRDVGALDALVAAEVARAMATTGGEVQRIALPGAFAPAGIEQGEVGTLTTLGSYGGIAEHAAGQLDSETGHRIMMLIRSIVRTEGVTAVVATHDPMMLDVADRVLVLRDGRLAEAPADRG